MRNPGRWAALVALAALLLAAGWLSPRVIPYNMDELVHYHALGCATAEGSRDLPPIRDGCAWFDLRPPLAPEPLPLRAYSYIGSVPILLFSSRRWDRLHTPEVEAALGPPRRTWQFGSWWAVEYDPVRSASPPR